MQAFPADVGNTSLSSVSLHSFPRLAEPVGLAYGWPETGIPGDPFSYMEIILHGSFLLPALQLGKHT